MMVDENEDVKVSFEKELKFGCDFSTWKFSATATVAVLTGREFRVQFR